MADFKEVKAAAAADAEPVTVTIFQKDGDPYLGADGKPCTVSVIGTEAPSLQKARRKIVRAAQRRAMSGQLTDADIDLRDRQELAAAVVGWSGWEVDGKPWPCTHANVMEMLSVEHVRNQVWAGVYQHAVFFEKESASSSPSRESGHDSVSPATTDTQPVST